MTLLTAGYWHTTYWAENYWMQDYWLEYGTAAPPVAPTVGDKWIGPPVPRPKMPVEFIWLLHDYLISKQEGE